MPYTPKILAKIVSNNHLAIVVKRYFMTQLIQSLRFVSQEEMIHGSRSDFPEKSRLSKIDNMIVFKSLTKTEQTSVLSSAFEAIIGRLSIDVGFERLGDWIMSLIIPESKEWIVDSPTKRMVHKTRSQHEGEENEDFDDEFDEERERRKGRKEENNEFDDKQERRNDEEEEEAQRESENKSRFQARKWLLEIQREKPDKSFLFPRSKLNKICSSHSWALPEYRYLGTVGKLNSAFRVGLFMNGHLVEEGFHSTKEQAARNAATNVLLNIFIDPLPFSFFSWGSHLPHLPPLFAAMSERLLSRSLPSSRVHDVDSDGVSKTDDSSSLSNTNDGKKTTKKTKKKKKTSSSAKQKKGRDEEEDESETDPSLFLEKIVAKRKKIEKQIAAQNKKKLEKQKERQKKLNQIRIETQRRKEKAAQKSHRQ